MVDRFAKADPITGPLPRVSLVIPARNEGDHIEACLRGLKKQTYSNLEVILVNDRSTDHTGEVMQRYTNASPNWQYIEIKSLPEGWLGKNHALEQGGLKATGEYIVFTDGDVTYEPHTILTTMQTVLTHKLDHLVLSATLKATDPLLIAMQALFAVGMISFLRLHELGKSPDRYMGAGVFNLVKTSLYRSIGGHKSIRLEIVDDLMLAKIMVQAGGKPGFLDGRNLISLEWYANWKQMILGFEKNGFASVKYSITRLILFLIGTYVIYLLPYFGVFLFHAPLSYIFGASLIIAHGIMAEVSRQTGHSPWTTLLLPFAAILIGFSILRSAVLTLYRGKVMWRDTSYNLEVLKSNTRL